MSRLNDGEPACPPPRDFSGGETRRAIVEVRVPTYRRPDLLKRALASLIDQEYRDWNAVVLDDSPGREAQSVVAALGDVRIVYSANSDNLGLLKNLSKAFQPAPFLPSSDYGCVLEDDNYYRPGFLARAVSRLSSCAAPVFLSNAQIAQYFQNGQEVVQDRYTMSGAYGDSPRLVPFQERLRFVPDHCAIANACLLWRFRSGVDLSVATESYNQIVQETMRAVITKVDFFYDPAPEVVWTNFADRSAAKRSRWRQKIHGWRWSRSELEMLRFWHREVSACGGDLIDHPKWRNVLSANGGGAASSLSSWGNWRTRLRKTVLTLFVPHPGFP